MITHGRNIFCDHVDIEDVRDHWIRKMHRMVNRGIEYFNNSASAALTNVKYETLVAEPLETVHEFYRSWSQSLDEPAKDAIARELRMLRANKSDRHEYDLADFGVEKGLIESKFSAYYHYLNSI